MANPFDKPISKVSLRTLLSATPEEISHLTARESQTFEKRLAGYANRRLATIEKHGKFSAAKEAYLTDSKKGLRGLDRSKFKSEKDYRNALQHNITRYKLFLKAKTSTLRGIKVRTKNVESRVFGVDSRGNPLQHFNSAEEEQRFWSAYQEFRNEYKNYAAAFESAKVQQFLGAMTFWRSREFTQDDLKALVDKIMLGENSFSTNVSRVSVGWDEEGEEEWD